MLFNEHRRCGSRVNLSIFIFSSTNDMESRGKKETTQSPRECRQSQPLHPCGSTEFCPEDPEKCIFFKGGLR
jgi:hypothetical protein